MCLGILRWCNIMRDISGDWESILQYYFKCSIHGFMHVMHVAQLISVSKKNFNVILCSYSNCLDMNQSEIQTSIWLCTSSCSQKQLTWNHVDPWEKECLYFLFLFQLNNARMQTWCESVSLEVFNVRFCNWICIYLKFIVKSLTNRSFCMKQEHQAWPE